ncbi:MAG TPA: serine/threonine-protein kinase [Stellaceae bacterium]|jgi:serine/threonine-protein kinase
MDRPSSVGRYKITRWMTSGAMGDIYEAHDPLIERPIALKILRRELLERGDAEGWLQRFRHEARAAGRLLHPNIVTLLDYGEEGGLPFLAMELVEGEGLDIRLRRDGHLSRPAAITLIAQVLNALEFAHANQVIHRDVKPSNILLTKTGLVKVADFGIAHIEASDLTTEGDVLGTPSYMSPEQLLGRVVDHRSDQFSAAAVFFELLTGQKPFQGKSLAESMLNMERRGPADVCALNEDVSPALRQVINRALSYDCGDRYPTTVEFARAIAEVATTAATPAAAAPAPDETVFAPKLPISPPPRPAEGQAEPSLAPWTSSSSAPMAMPAVAPPPPPASMAAPRPDPAEQSADATPLAIELLSEVERDLTTFIGPMAKIAVRRAAKTTVDLVGLYQSLASYIDAQGDRDTFIRNGLRRSATIGGPATDGGSRRPLTQTGVTGQNSLSLALAPDALRQIEADLTTYIGPIAPIVLRRLLSKSSSVADLYRDLATYIPDEHDRDNFLNSRQGLGNGGNR